ncbi:hypothetical protein WMY93_009794 [Mugilogobius chulae]|uniref:Protein kinase domain-containing protein n=1 Tax=Mugilogobius chulae TaxID=88201 RepID=A0AAW0PFL4_9GOBI
MIQPQMSVSLDARPGREWTLLSNLETTALSKPQEHPAEELQEREQQQRQRTPVTIPASPFMKKLGCGTGVNVYLMDRLGKLNLSPWAVKKVNSKCASKQVSIYQKRLNEEAQILKGLKHPNIVGFRAIATATDGSKCLAMEYGGEQSLNDMIEKRREEYLHNEKKLLHGDMKSCNVVIKGDFETVKICDVGFHLSDPKAEYIGTEPWNAKEVMEGGEISDRTDIFAYGLTLWEMMTLSMPHLESLDDEEEEEEEDGDESEEESFDEDAYYERLGTRPALDAETLVCPTGGWWSCSTSVPKRTPKNVPLPLRSYRL